MKYREPKRILVDRDPEVFFETAAIPCQFCFLHLPCLTRESKFPFKRILPTISGSRRSRQVLGLPPFPAVAQPFADFCPPFCPLFMELCGTLWRPSLGTGLDGFTDPATKQANEKLLFVGDNPRFWGWELGEAWH